MDENPETVQVSVSSDHKSVSHQEELKKVYITNIQPNSTVIVTYTVVDEGSNEAKFEHELYFYKPYIFQPTITFIPVFQTEIEAFLQVDQI